METLKKTSTVKSISCLIVDDEAGGRENLRTLIEEFFPDVSVKGMASSAAAANNFLLQQDVDVVFLDIMMPNKTGLDFIREIDSNKQNIVFVTAYENYALQALKADALDYILKPIGINDLGNAIEKVGKKLELKKQQTNSAYNKKLTVSTEKGLQVIDTKQIIYIQAEDSYSHIYRYNEDKLFLSKNLKHFSNILSPAQFVRIHRSFLLNLSFVKSFTRNQQAKIQLIDGRELPVSRRKVKTLIDRLYRFNKNSK